MNDKQCNFLLNLDERDIDNERSHSLSTAEAVATTAVVCGVFCFTAGLLLGFLLTRCHGCRRRKVKRELPVYEDVPDPLEKRSTIELQKNEAYGHISQNYRSHH